MTAKNQSQTVSTPTLLNHKVPDYDRPSLTKYGSWQVVTQIGSVGINTGGDNDENNY